MAKRFADTALSREGWYRKLSPVHKCVWRFLCDECDLAGVWSIDEEALAFSIGSGVELGPFLEAVNADGKNRVQKLGRGKLFLTGFVEFQYGELSEGSRVHQSVVRTLKKYSLWKGYGKAIQWAKDKDKEKDKDKNKEEGGVGGDFDPEQSFDAFWGRYPRKIKKTEARDRYLRLIHDSEQAKEILTAVERFRAYHEQRGTEEQYLPYPASFMGVEKKQDWRDWLDDENGKCDIIPAGEFVGLTDPDGPGARP